MITIDQLESEATRLLQILVGWLVSPQFYAQIGAIIVAVALAISPMARSSRRRFIYFRQPEQVLKIGRWIYSCRDLLFPILAVLMLAIAVQLLESVMAAGIPLVPAKEPALLDTCLSLPYHRATPKSGCSSVG